MVQIVHLVCNVECNSTSLTRHAKAHYFRQNFQWLRLERSFLEQAIYINIMKSNNFWIVSLTHYLHQPYVRYFPKFSGHQEHFSKTLMCTLLPVPVQYQHNKELKELERFVEKECLVSRYPTTSFTYKVKIKLCYKVSFRREEMR